MPGLLVPQGELETFGVGKEVTFGTFQAPTIWHCFRKHDPKITTDAVTRAPRASLADPYPGTGGRLVTSSLDVECTVDTFPQWLAYTLGNQAAPTATLLSTTLAATMATGATTATLTSMIGVFVGMSLTIGSDTLTVSGISAANAVSFSAGGAATHNNGVAVTSTMTGAKMTKMTLGSPLPSFSYEVNRPSSICTDYLGGCVDQLQLSMAQKQGLTAKLSLLAKDAVTQNSPTSATLSALNPYIYEQQNTFAQMGGEVFGLSTAASLLSVSLTINNNLMKNWYTFGTGNQVRSFPEQLRKVSGTMTLGFESATQLNNFNAARTGGNLPSVSVLLPIVGTDLIASGNCPYALTIYLPKVFLSTHSIADDTSKAITQTVAFTCAESVPGASDQMTVYSYNTNSAIY